MSEPNPTQERDRLLAYLRPHLLRPALFDSHALPALAEAESTGAGHATADNALAAEALALPTLHPRDPAMAAATLDFVLALGAGPRLHRKVAPPLLSLLRDDPHDFELLTATHRFSGDLSRGLLHQAMRGGAGSALHSGNLVEFRFAGRRHCIDVEDHITSYGIAPAADRIALWHESMITAPGGLLRRRAVTLGTLRYSYTVTATDPMLHLTVSFQPAAGRRLPSGLRLTTALDNASADPGHPRDTLLVGEGASATPHRLPAAAGLLPWHDGPATLLTLLTGAQPDAPALLLRPGHPAGLLNAKAVAQRPGQLHWLVLRHTPQAEGAARVAREDRLLLARNGRDPAACAEPGQALLAVATALLFGPLNGLPPSRAAALETWFTRRLAAWWGDAGSHAALAPTADLAALVLALDARLRATGSAADRLAHAHALELLLARQQGAPAGATPGAAWFARAGEAPSLGPHGRALAALARAATLTVDARLPAALSAALLALRGQPALGLLLPDGSVRHAHTTRTEELGLLLRGLRALMAAARAGRAPLGNELQQHLAGLVEAALRTLRGRYLMRGEALLVAHAAGTPEGDVKAQAAVLLGLSDPDALAIGIAPPAAETVAA